MRNTLIGAALAFVLGFAGFYALNSYIYSEKQKDETLVADYKNGWYLISGEFVRLEDGISRVPIDDDSASVITTQYFGNEARGDLDGDGDEDIVFLLTQDGSGSGIFFYLVGAINEGGNYRGTHAVFIGDRIAPQTTEFRDGRIIVNYADRVPGEAMAATPTVGKSLYLKYDPDALQFGEVVQDFEGEADPSRMSLGMKTWNWISALYNDGREFRPRESGVFTLTLNENGGFSATTDCNSMGGQYTADEDSISFSQIISTKKYCFGSQENEFAALLENTQLYHFTSRGELVLDLKFDSGSAIFR